MSEKSKSVATYLESGRAGAGAMSSEWSADDPWGSWWDMVDMSVVFSLTDPEWLHDRQLQLCCVQLINEGILRWFRQGHLSSGEREFEMAQLNVLSFRFGANPTPQEKQAS